MFRLRPGLTARTSLLLLPAAFVALNASGCNLVQKLPFVGKNAAKADTANAATPAPKTPATPTPPQIDYAKVRPNELGRIPVLMYHDIGAPPKKHEYNMNRAVADFRKDLELLYAAGFRPVNLSDAMTGKIDIAPGMSPVVITFDDARETQFKLIETDKALKIDPNCGLGVLQAFHKEHPDWAVKAMFFCLPKSDKTIDPFGQVRLGDQKLQYLVDNGLEIGNHTVHHRNMGHMTPEQIQAEIGDANNRLLSVVPKAKIDVVALPMGVYPRKKADWKYLTSGTFGGKSYSYAGAMMAAYRPIPSPMSKDFNPMRMERIAPMDNDPNGVRNWIIKLSAASGDRYISDGDPNVVSYPKSEEAKANVSKIKSEGLLANVYSPFGGSGSGAKPIIAEGDEAGSSSTTAQAGGEESQEKFQVVPATQTTQTKKIE